MAKLSNLQDSNLIKVFVMGEPGTGKSVGASTFEGPLKFYDFDGKISSVYRYWKAKDPTKLDMIDYEDCKPSDGKGSSFAKLNDSLGEITKSYKETGKLDYKTIVIDSCTIMASEMLVWLINFETGIKRNKDIKSRKVSSMQDYMIYNPMFIDFIYKLFSLPCHIVMTGHVGIDKDDITGAIERYPLIPGQTAKKKIGVIFPEVYVSSVVDGKYIVQTQADYKYPCRSQLQGIPKLTEFNFDNLKSYLN